MLNEPSTKPKSTTLNLSKSITNTPIQHPHPTPTTNTHNNPQSHLVPLSSPSQLPSGSFKPKQSLGQNFLTDSNTITRIINAFHSDATRYSPSVDGLVELGPGPGALTQVLIERYGTEEFRCIEIDQRAVEVLNDR